MSWTNRKADDTGERREETAALCTFGHNDGLLYAYKIDCGIWTAISVLRERIAVLKLFSYLSRLSGGLVSGDRMQEGRFYTSY